MMKLCSDAFAAEPQLHWLAVLAEAFIANLIAIA